MLETVGPLADSRMEAFAAKAEDIPSSQVPEDRRMGRLKQLDPAEKLLELKVCDPTMGSGHFLVNLVDYLADRVIEAMAEAEALVEGYLSPLVERIDEIRNTIMDNAEDRGWTFDPAQLDDRHIVRRMVLKRCVYGVDKNPMAVELARAAAAARSLASQGLALASHLYRRGTTGRLSAAGSGRPQPFPSSQRLRRSETPTHGSTFPVAHGLAFSAGPRPVLWASADTPAGRSVELAIRRPAAALNGLPARIPDSGATPPGEGGMGVHMPPSPMPYQAS